MSNPDISGYGLQLVLKASHTFPNGVPLSDFADDADPFDVPSIAIADVVMGLNGDMPFFSKATPTEISLSFIPGSESDKNLNIVFTNNRVSKGSRIVHDEITLIGTYPNGAEVTASLGVMTEGPPVSSVSSAGRLKSKTYKMKFAKLESK
jgi:hypothetical protein